jgi:NAD(P) transhydrogenase subunit alpha
MTVVRDGEKTWPPPPVAVSAAPVATPAAAPAVKAEAKQPMTAGRRFGIVGVAAVALFLITALSPPALIGHLVVFALAIVIGYYVIGNVHHALHTPLMSVTNAISGIIVVGGLLNARGGSGGLPSSVIVAIIATLFATINIAGGFLVTRRMLAMFRK